MEMTRVCEPEEEQIEDIIYDDSSCSESSNDSDCSDFIDDDTLSEGSISSEESEWIESDEEDIHPEPKRRKQ
jgi:translation elongation factor P/translation initiation factor 5A